MPVTPWVYLSSFGPGAGQRAATSAASRLITSVGAQLESDVDEFDPTAVAQRVNGFEAAEGHGQRGVHGGPADRPGLHVDAAGDVDGHHRDARLVDGGENLGSGGTQRAGAGDADDAVDHQIGCGRDALHHPAAGLPEGGQRLLVGAFGIEQHRGGGGAPATQERDRPQRVTAVVAGADDRADRAAGDAAGVQDELTGDRGGQAVGRPAHQRTVGQRSPAAALRPRGSGRRCSSAASLPHVTWRGACWLPVPDHPPGRDRRQPADER